jgi:methanogenic corrinoid protein MtbC1
VSANATRIEAATEPMFPMRVVTRTTGLTSDLVRAWERRYKAIEPGRTGGNARRYSQADIARLELLRDAVAEGHAISRVASLDNQALDKLRMSRKESQQKLTTESVLERYLAAIARYDLPAAEALLSRAAQLLGPRETVLNVVSPLMRTVGERWHAGDTTVAEEHAVSAQIRGLLATLLRTATLPSGAPRILVGAPAGHHHELGALIASVLAAEAGVQPIYLGPDVPWKELGVAAKAARATLIVLAMSLRPEAPTIRREQTELARLSKSIDVWLGTPSNYAVQAGAKVRSFHDYTTFETALTHRFKL